jgi:hypothetical protein
MAAAKMGSMRSRRQLQTSIHCVITLSFLGRLSIGFERNGSQVFQTGNASKSQNTNLLGAFISKQVECKLDHFLNQS